ncbi:hypothetical protein evm_002513 [Chilo suppressalis]|nr:hypothetical protein evm_002513 [Chilo suppressalis]
MARCVNCNIAIRINQPYHYSALSMGPEIVSIIEEWISREVTVADSICQECINLIIVNLSNNNEDNSVAQQIGHQSVCVCCGLSISRRSGRHFRPLLNEHPERAYIANIINPHQISANARACNACWQRAHYHSIRELIEPPQIVSVETLESESSSVVLKPLAALCRKPKTALGLYLMKIRTGEPIRRIASLMCISKSVAKIYIKKARNCLKDFYVPLHLGINHISRESLSSRNLLIPQATTSDATIMLELFQSERSPIRQYFRQNDVFILDRGFRDSIPLLNSLNYNVYKPETLSEGETQLSTDNANKSRLVTLCRWVVEVVNGRFKRDFKIFRNKYFNIGSKNLMDDFKIAGAIINQFHPVLTDRPDAQSILERATQQMYVQNYLADHVIMHQLNRHRANCVQINAQLPQLDMFPIMEMSDLILFSLGTYQIKQARSYYGEHIRVNGTFSIEVSDDVRITNVAGISSSHETV